MDQDSHGQIAMESESQQNFKPAEMIHHDDNVPTPTETFTNDAGTFMNSKSPPYSYGNSQDLRNSLNDKRRTIGDSKDYPDNTTTEAGSLIQSYNQPPGGMP